MRVVAFDAFIDRQSREQRRCEQRGGAEQQRAEHGRHPQAIGTQEREQPADVARAAFLARALAGPALPAPGQAGTKAAPGTAPTRTVGAHSPLTSRSCGASVRKT